MIGMMHAGQQPSNRLRLTSVDIKGYRSIRSIRFPVHQLTVFVGKNGVGKTNLYRGLSLLRDAADSSITHAITKEGGVESVLWAGRRRRSQRVRLILEAEFGDFRYSIEIGLPAPTEAALPREPLVKEEELAFIGQSRPVLLMQRKGPTCWLTDDDGRRQVYEGAVLPSETALGSFVDAASFPETSLVRREMLGWRFYHDFRSDIDSPIREPSLAVSSPTLSPDGSNLAAVIETLARIRQDTTEINEAIDDAFPGAQLTSWTEEGRCSIAMHWPDMPRPFAAHELSDGTLRYLCLVGALSGYRLPSFIALNEPESSLHPELIGPLARLIVRASANAQIWVVTHSTALSDEIQRCTDIEPKTVTKDGGATWIQGLSMTGEFRSED